MSDTRAAMREFRFLDDKRKQGGLSAAEEQRWTELRHSLGLEREAAAIQLAVDRAITDGCRTRDLGGTLTTTAMTDEIITRLA